MLPEEIMYVEMSVGGLPDRPDRRDPGQRVKDEKPTGILFA